MREKRTFYSELAYFVGIVVLALGTVLMERADFGMSMVVAPAYLIHLKVSQVFPFFSFGMSEYVFQAFLLIVLSAINGKVKQHYLLSFITAFLYGLVLDLLMALPVPVAFAGIVWRIVLYAVGLCTCSVGVALLFHTYFPPEAYELFVKELSRKYRLSISKTKTVYDCCSCGLGILLSLVFFRDFVGVRWGTLLCAVINGWLIGQISGFLEDRFAFRDALPLRARMLSA